MEFLSPFGKEAVLGQFNGNWYEDLTENNGWINYFNFNNYINVEWKRAIPLFVHNLYKTFDKINFLLDGIKLPLNPEKSVTCAELKIIIDNNYLDKVQFWVKGEQIETDKVLKIFKLVGENNITFDNLDFDSI